MQTHGKIFIFKRAFICLTLLSLFAPTSATNVDMFRANRPCLEYLLY